MGGYPQKLWITLLAVYPDNLQKPAPRGFATDRRFFGQAKNTNKINWLKIDQRLRQQTAVTSPVVTRSCA